MKKLIIASLLMCSLGMIGCGEPNIKGTIIKKEIVDNRGYLTIKTENDNKVRLQSYRSKIQIYQENSKVIFQYDKSDGYITYLRLDEGQSDS